MNQSMVSFASGQTVLVGAFVVPGGPGSHPTVLLIAGSGPLDRDGNHKRLPLGLSRDLAGLLVAPGWASIRYDKRGVGESGGDYLSTGFFDELADAEAAYHWLGGRHDVGPVVAVGHSAGSSMAAEMTGGTQPGGRVLPASPARTGEATLRRQARRVNDHLLPAPVNAALEVFGTSVVKQQAKAIDRLKATTGDTVRINLVKTNAKWMREFIAYDPVPALRRAKAPLLAITGSNDIHVDPGDLAITAEVAPEDTKALVVEDVDHILRHEPLPVSNPRRYRNQIEKPIDPRVVSALLDWLQRVNP